MLAANCDWNARLLPPRPRHPSTESSYSFQHSHQPPRLWRLTHYSLCPFRSAVCLPDHIRTKTHPEVSWRSISDRSIAESSIVRLPSAHCLTARYSSAPLRIARFQTAHHHRRGAARRAQEIPPMTALQHTPTRLIAE